ncbi:hypothetical protein BJ944DRAFT_273019 [Cunninghamella echinulata]|nr:hypothetical protein BJ944DRAFT_273019 [Cunninghamella echinulata]
MTLKSPFYNKPSTSTSVDSCHKCPAISPIQNKDIHVPFEESATTFKVSKDQSTGFDQRLSEPSINTSQTVAVEPSNACVTTSDNHGTPSLTSCSNCGTTSTPLWRRSPQGETICNACGLYLKARNTTRPPWLKRNSTKRPVPLAPVALAPAPIAMKLPIHPSHLIPIQKMPISSSASLSSSNNNNNNENNNDNDKATTTVPCDGNRNMVCFNCHTNTTPLWRRDGEGNTICNACGLYYKLHNVHRPITMKRSIIKRRKRVAIPATMTTTTCNNNNEIVGMKRKSSIDHHDDTDEEVEHSPMKRMELPLLAAKLPSSSPSSHHSPIEPDAFQQQHRHRHLLPSPPLQPIKSSNIANLLNPSHDDNDKNNYQLPSISLPGLPSPPLIAYDHHHHYHRRSISPSPSLSSPTSTTMSSSDHSPSPPPMSPPSSSSVSFDHHHQQSSSTNNNNNSNTTVAAAAAAAFATVSALLNPSANRQQTHKMLEAHRHELQREVSNLTSMLSRTTAMLENLDQVMAVTSRDNNNKNTTTNSNNKALESILALTKAATATTA